MSRRYCSLFIASVCISMVSLAAISAGEEPKLDLVAMKRTVDILEREIELYSSDTVESTLHHLSKNLDVKIYIEGKFRKKGLERDAIEISRKGSFGSILQELLRKCELEFSLRSDGTILVRNAAELPPRRVVE